MIRASISALASVRVTRILIDHWGCRSHSDFTSRFQETTASWSLHCFNNQSNDGLWAPSTPIYDLFLAVYDVKRMSQLHLSVSLPLHASFISSRPLDLPTVSLYLLGPWVCPRHFAWSSGHALELLQGPPQTKTGPNLNLDINPFTEGPTVQAVP